jgi:hypothetical protein
MMNSEGRALEIHEITPDAFADPVETSFVLDGVPLSERHER